MHVGHRKCLILLVVLWLFLVMSNIDVHHVQHDVQHSIFKHNLLIYIVFSPSGSTYKAGYIYINKISSILIIYIYTLR